MNGPSTPSAPHARKRRSWLRLAVVTTLAVLVLCGIAAVFLPLVWPVEPLQGTKVPAQLRDRDSRFAVVDGSLVHFKLYGSKDASETILLLHGFGASSFSWREVGPVLGGQYRVVVIDRPGFGLTERRLPPSGFAWSTDGPYSVRSQAELAYSLLDQLEVGRATIIGHSQGASVAVAMAVMSPQRVKALVLDAPDVGRNGPVPAWITPLLRTPQGRAVGPLILRNAEPSSIDMLLRRSFADPSNVTTAVVAGYRKPWRVENWDKGLWESIVSAQPLNARVELGKLEGIPTLVIIPGEDRLVAPSTQRKMAAAIPGAKVVEAPGQGNVYHEEQPSRWVKTVADFLHGALGQ